MSDEREMEVMDLFTEDDTGIVDEHSQAEDWDEDDGGIESDRSLSEEDRVKVQSKVLSPVRGPSTETSNRMDTRDCEESIRYHNSKAKYLFKGARYYVIKSGNHENVALSKAKGVWSTPPQNEARLNSAFKKYPNVILIFSVKESGHFQGFARLAQESDDRHPPIRWIVPAGINPRALRSVLRLDWINKQSLPFSSCDHLYNPWNENKRVKIGRDGQEIEPSVGEALCKLFPEDPESDLSLLGRMAKRAVLEYKDRRRNVVASSHVVSRPPSEERCDGDMHRTWSKGRIPSMRNREEPPQHRPSTRVLQSRQNSRHPHSHHPHSHHPHAHHKRDRPVFSSYHAPTPSPLPMPPMYPVAPLGMYDMYSIPMKQYGFPSSSFLRHSRDGHLYRSDKRPRYSPSQYERDVDNFLRRTRAHPIDSRKYARESRRNHSKERSSGGSSRHYYK